MLLDFSLSQLREQLDTQIISVTELVDECYTRIVSLQPRLNAFITIVHRDEVEKKIKHLEQKKTRHQPLAGIPFVLKDSYVTTGIRTTAASAVLDDFIPPYTATVVRKLEDAGAILIGKMNMDAWGHGGSTENTDFGPTKNPWDLSRVAGGSSGGPAAAIAARLAPFAIGEDTGGSIRNPAAWCNITGLKVSYGRVSRYGCIAYASSFDTVGPLAKSVEDCALVLETIAGQDPYDATSSPHPVPSYSAGIASKRQTPYTVGIVKECFGDGLDPQIATAIETAAKQLEKLGCTIKEISMPLLPYGLSVYYLIGPSETSSNLARYDGIRYGNGRDKFTPETMRRILIGTYALSAGYYDAYYKKAQQARTLFIQAYQEALQQCDVLLMPVNPTLPPRIGELVSDPLANMLADVYTTSQNPVGVPSLAVPCGFTKDQLPIGMQLIGPMFSEELLLHLGHAYQQHTDWHTKAPPIGPS